MAGAGRLDGEPDLVVQDRESLWSVCDRDSLDDVVLGRVDTHDELRELATHPDGAGSDRDAVGTLADRDRRRDARGDASCRIDPRDGAVKRVRDPHGAGAERDAGRPVAHAHRLYHVAAQGIDADDAPARLVRDPDTSAADGDAAAERARPDPLDRVAATGSIFFTLRARRRWSPRPLRRRRRQRSASHRPESSGRRGSLRVDPRHGGVQRVRHPDRAGPDRDPARIAADVDALDDDRVRGSMRETEPSCAFVTHTDPSPTATLVGPLPTGTAATSRFDPVSIAAIDLPRPS